MYNYVVVACSNFNFALSFLIIVPLDLIPSLKKQWSCLCPELPLQTLYSTRSISLQAAQGQFDRLFPTVLLAPQNYDTGSLCFILNCTSLASLFHWMRAQSHWSKCNVLLSMIIDGQTQSSFLQYLELSSNPSTFRQNRYTYHWDCWLDQCGDSFATIDSL
jgi:hypothetical protein